MSAGFFSWLSVSGGSSSGERADMGYQLISLGALIVVGVILANMIKNSSGTTAFFNGLGSLWGMSINGLLGTTSTSTSTSKS